MAVYQAKRSRLYGGQVELEGGPIKTSLETYVLKALPEDLVTVLRGVALQELNEQIAIKNNPTQVLVDGRAVGQRNIIEAQRAVSMRFVDNDMVIQATYEAYRLLRRVTREQNPAKNALVARRNFYLYRDGKSVGLMPFAIQTVTNASVTQDTVLRIVGPIVPYGRKLYWNPVGRGKVMQFQQKLAGSGALVYNSKYQPRFKAYSTRSLKRLANKTDNPAQSLQNFQKQRPGFVEGTNQIVKRILRQNKLFAGLYISDGWISYPPAKRWGKSSKNDKVPSISIRMAKKGNVRVVNL